MGSGFMLWLLLLVLVLSSSLTDGYRPGEIIDTDWIVNGGPTDVLRGQSPKFAQSSSVRLSLLPEHGSAVYLSFEDGIWYTSSMDTSKYDEMTVRFVYSGSSIHSVSSSSSTSRDKHNRSGVIRVHYEWIPEHRVTVERGQNFLLVGMLLSGLVVLIVSCSGPDETTDHQPQVPSSSHASKWD